MVDGALYVPDSGSNRVLRFASIPATNGAAADAALGQPDLYSSDAGSTGASGMYWPESPSSSAGKLAVADYHSSRVLLWDAAPAESGAPASVVVGWTDFATPSDPLDSCRADRLLHPEAARLVGGKLVVVDSWNNRVLVWNTVPTENGTAADLVLGQASMTTCAPNDEDGDGATDAAPSAKTFDYPTDVWSDGTRLAVVDEFNDRVLVWTTFPTSSQAPATFVLGQAGFATNAEGASASQMAVPYGVASDGNRLFVSDQGNNRVLVWDTFPDGSGAPAKAVIGQAGFGRTDPNADDPLGATPSARTLYGPSGVFVSGGSLFVTDTFNNRVLVFTP